MSSVGGTPEGPPPRGLGQTDVARVQRRTVGWLSLAQVVGGVGSGSGLSVGALLVKDVSGSSGWAGLATTMLTLGAALIALPLASLAARSGRRPSLTVGWFVAATGALLVIAAAQAGSLPLVLAGLFVSGTSSATNLQSRYAAADLAEPQSVGRSLSLVVWSTTLGAVLGPNLTGPGASLARAIGIPDLAGPFLFSATAFVCAGLLMFASLRPDPLVLATRLDTRPAPTAVRRSRIRHAWSVVRASEGATTGILTVATGHACMVSVMAMTPVHMQDHGAQLSVIGLTISLHIAGMFALSPVMGILTDRWGRGRTIILGQATLLLATLVAGTSGESEVRIAVGLVLLGLGWSASLIAGSSLVVASVEIRDRASVQGLSDLTMNLAGAVGGLVAGLVVALWGFGPLNVVVACLTAPVIRRVLSGMRSGGHLDSAPRPAEAD